MKTCTLGIEVAYVIKVRSEKAKKVACSQLRNFLQEIYDLKEKYPMIKEKKNG